jgi:hypothetical protein
METVKQPKKRLPYEPVPEEIKELKKTNIKQYYSYIRKRHYQRHREELIKYHNDIEKNDRETVNKRRKIAKIKKLLDKNLNVEEIKKVSNEILGKKLQECYRCKAINNQVIHYKDKTNYFSDIETYCQACLNDIKKEEEAFLPNDLIKSRRTFCIN